MPDHAINALPQSAAFAALPALWPDDLRPQLQAAAANCGRKLVVLDDDPTGTQTVHDIAVVTNWSVDTLAAELLHESAGFFILTNSRSLTPAATVALHRELAAHLAAASASTRVRVTLVSRSDSTLRGHFPLETDTLNEGLGPFHGTLLMPYFEAGGRYTVNGIHYVAESGLLVPAAETPFARDASFGYRHSRLAAWVEEKTAGRIRSGDVIPLTIDLIRRGGPEAVARTMLAAPAGSLFVSDGADPRDAEVVALATYIVEAAGKTVLARTAAAFVAARLGLVPRPLLDAADFSGPSHGAGGLVVVGSYVPKTTAQLRHLSEHRPHRQVELSVAAALDAGLRSDAIETAAIRINRSLAEGELVVLHTSRELVTGASPTESLAIVNRVSSALVAVVRQITIQPRFLIAKGGITSSDIATGGLGVRRALVRGQLLPGVPVWRLGTETRFPFLNYIVFPGNVGGDSALTDAVDRLTPAS